MKLIEWLIPDCYAEHYDGRPERPGRYVVRTVDNRIVIRRYGPQRPGGRNEWPTEEEPEFPAYAGWRRLPGRI